MKTLLLQLPLNPAAPLEDTGNAPLAGAALAAAAGLPKDSVADRRLMDSLGDRALVEWIKEKSPSLIAFTLYMWNAERSVHLARELNKVLPEALMVAGGPEVTVDNHWLRGTGAFDLLVSGEGEPIAGDVLESSGVRSLIERHGDFLKAPGSDHTPGTYPDPWLTGYLDPSAGSVLVETIRGCGGSCSYCSYRRTRSRPRVMKNEDCISLLKTLDRAGAEEVVFIDPTFNAKRDWRSLLKAMSGMGMKAFCELRGDTVTPEYAAMMRRAGFETVEIGLQSCNSETLRRAGRDGSPTDVMRGSGYLKRAGVTPIMDVMLGLPGDRPEDSVKAAMMLRDRGLHSEVQVFYLAILPGTALRRTKGLEYMKRPPYYRFGKGDMGGFADARERIADVVGYDLDMEERPLVLTDWPGTEELDLDRDPRPDRIMPSRRHGSVRIRGRDLWKHRAYLLELVRTRVEADPFCVLDVILIPDREFPLDLIDDISRLRQHRDYSARRAQILGMQGNLRISILIERPPEFPEDWINHAASCCNIIFKTDSPKTIFENFHGENIYIQLNGHNWDLDSLSSEVDSLWRVLFTSQQMERRWCLHMSVQPC